MPNSAPTSAATASQLSMHHCERSPPSNPAVRQLHQPAGEQNPPGGWLPARHAGPPTCRASSAGSSKSVEHIFDY